MTFQEALIKAYNKLQEGKIELARFEAELLLEFASGRSKEFIMINPETELEGFKQEELDKLIARRLDGEPIAYLVGSKGFYGLNFLVDERVLIPRPETELIVDDVIETVKDGSSIVDLGTGSGCIIVSLARSLKKRDGIRFAAIDISDDALTVARANAKANEVERDIEFIHGSLFEPFVNDLKRLEGLSDLVITANLPYLTPEQVENSPSIQKEPKLALVAGDDGLDCYRNLFRQLVVAKGEYPELNIKVYCEIDLVQNEIIVDLCEKELPEASYELRKDLRGLDRLFIVKM